MTTLQTSGKPIGQQLSTTLTNPRVVAVLSFLLSAWLIHIDPVVNRDGILYLRTADAFVDGGMAAGFALFDRPLLPFAFALLHELTGLSLLTSAHVLISLLYAGLSVSFLHAVRVLGGNRQVQLIAVLLILAHPIINDYRSSIMRDPGYWMFSLLAMLELLHYSRQPSNVTSLRWLAYMGMAVLFRFEGTLLALMTPLALLWTMQVPLLRRLRYMLQLQLPVAAVSAMVLVAVGITPEESLLPHINNYANNLLYFSDVIDNIAQRVGPELLRESAVEHARTAVFGGLVAIFLRNLVFAMPILLAVVLAAGWWRGWLGRIPRDAIFILNTHVAACASYLLVFTFTNQFMLERYVSQIVIFLLLYVSFAGQGMWSEQRFRTPIRALAVLFSVLMIGDILHNNDYRKAYVEEATKWLRASTPHNATLLATDKHIAYFSERRVDWSIPQNLSINEMITQNLWQRHQYIALSINRGSLGHLQALYSHPELRVLKSFTNDRLDTVIVLENTRYESRAAQL